MILNSARPVVTVYRKYVVQVLNMKTNWNTLNLTQRSRLTYFCIFHFWNYGIYLKKKSIFRSDDTTKNYLLYNKCSSQSELPMTQSNDSALLAWVLQCVILCKQHKSNIRTCALRKKSHSNTFFAKFTTLRWQMNFTTNR